MFELDLVSVGVAHVRSFAPPRLILGQGSEGSSSLP
jgi:hypothetical protein